MESVQNRNIGIMSLPRELRDKIYGYLRVIQRPYRADILAADTDTTTNLVAFRPWLGASISATGLRIPQSVIPVLQSSAALREEARRVLYKEATAKFLFGSRHQGPNVHFSNMRALALMQRIEIYLDLDEAFNYQSRDVDHDVAVTAMLALLESLSQISTVKQSLTLNIRCRMDSYAVLDAIAPWVTGMTIFSQVSVQVHPGYTPRLLPHPGRVPDDSDFERLIPRFRHPEFRRLADALSRELGPCQISYGIGGFNDLVYHPRIFLATVASSDIWMSRLRS